MDPRILWKLSYGVYAVCGQKDGKNFGCIANSAMQVTAEPASIAVSINHDNFTHDCLMETGRFALCILSETYPPLAIGKLGFYSGRDADKFSGLEYEMTGGLPVLKNACGYLICQVRQTLDAGTHTIFLADVADGALQSDAPPMTYAYYHNVIKGKSPKNAPTYRGQQPAKPREGQKSGYRCSVCGYVYEGKTAFEHLPEDYVCPICKVPKSKFEKIS